MLQTETGFVATILYGGLIPRTGKPAAFASVFVIATLFVTAADLGYRLHTKLSDGRSFEASCAEDAWKEHVAGPFSQFVGSCYSMSSV